MAAIERLATIRKIGRERPVAVDGILRCISGVLGLLMS
jgi:hypothetical protein